MQDEMAVVCSYKGGSRVSNAGKLAEERAASKLTDRATKAQSVGLTRQERKQSPTPLRLSHSQKHPTVTGAHHHHRFVLECDDRVWAQHCKVTPRLVPAAQAQAMPNRKRNNALTSKSNATPPKNAHPSSDSPAVYQPCRDHCESRMSRSQHSQNPIRPLNLGSGSRAYCSQLRGGKVYTVQYVADFPRTLRTIQVPFRRATSTVR